MHEQSFIKRFPCLALITFLCYMAMSTGLSGQEASSPTMETDEAPGSEDLFVVDRRIELFNVLQHLSASYHAKTTLTYDYSIRVEEYFENFRAHEAVTSLDKLVSFGFTYDAPISFFLHVSQELDSISSGLPQEVVQRAGGMKNLKYFLNTVRAFAEESRFDDFFEEQEGYYTGMITALDRRFSVNDIVHEVAAYYKTDLPGCHVILSTLTTGGFGPKVTEPDGRQYHITVASPMNLDDAGRPVYFSSDTSLRYLLWHELSHPIINPLVIKNWGTLDQYRHLTEAMKEKAPAWYQDDQVIYFENLVRAVTIRMTHLNLGRDAGEEHAKLQANWGFPFAVEFSEILATHEEQPFERGFGEFVREVKRLNEDLQQNGQ